MGLSKGTDKALSGDGESNVEMIAPHKKSLRRDTVKASSRDSMMVNRLPEIVVGSSLTPYVETVKVITSVGSARATQKDLTRDITIIVVSTM